MRIVFAAVLSAPPTAPGSILHRLHYLRGLRELGHDVYFVEETYEGAVLGDDGAPCLFRESANVRAFRSITSASGFDDRSCLLYDGGRETAGLSFDEVVRVARSADLLINMSGHLSPGPVFDGPRCRMYLDSDPVYTQLWHSQYGKDLGFDVHDVFATRGVNIGTDASPIPGCGIDWIPTLPPVVLRPTFQLPRPSAPYTTVASWDVFGDVEHDGEWYGSRRVELEKTARLPSLVDAPFEMRVRSFQDQDDGTIARLRAAGWRLAGGEGIGGVDDYLGYVDGSRGEIGIAKNAYVKARSGWFSERSAEYLAAARPAVVQSTGFEHVVPPGEGLLPFATVDEAADAVRAVDADLDRHARAARALAEDVFSHRVVLPALLEAAEARAR